MDDLSSRHPNSIHRDLVLASHLFGPALWLVNVQVKSGPGQAGETLVQKQFEDHARLLAALSCPALGRQGMAWEDERYGYRIAWLLYGHEDNLGLNASTLSHALFDCSDGPVRWIGQTEGIAAALDPRLLTQRWGLPTHSELMMYQPPGVGDPRPDQKFGLACSHPLPIASTKLHYEAIRLLRAAVPVFRN